MKKLTLSEAWRFCMEQWGDIIAQLLVDDTLCVESLKRKWCSERNYLNIPSSCFFCLYANNNSGRCDDCPGRLIVPDFSCHRTEYHYADRPFEFHKKIKTLHKLYLEGREENPNLPSKIDD